jgi:CDP-paratose 2-epimerase
MRAASATAMRVAPELALVVRVPPTELASIIPVSLVPADPFSEPEPSRGATIELASGRYVVVMYGEVTGTLSVHAVPADASDAIDDFLTETELDPSAIVWRRTRKRAKLASGDDYVLITGGAGFIGTNLAHRLLSEGRRVCVFDNLSRAGVERNLEWLQETHGDGLLVRIADIRDAATVSDAVRRASSVYHLAAQVAVTSSLDNPMEDFEINARGTLNVLEAIRGSRTKPPLVFASTNKVYGAIDDVDLREEGDRYVPAEKTIARHGISEARQLEFTSPYACSKGTADQYVRDYARSYGLRAVTLRMSAIYGPHQFGTEDQGWVAHFVIRALNRDPITIYGSGYQVRDVLYIDDAVDALLLTMENADGCAGRAFNLGGGSANTISLRELINLLVTFEGRMPRIEWSDWRTGEQKYFVSDIRRFQKATGWAPTASPKHGIRLLREWLIASGVPALVTDAGRDDAIGLQQHTRARAMIRADYEYPWA